MSVVDSNGMAAALTSTINTGLGLLEYNREHIIIINLRK